MTQRDELARIRPSVTQAGGVRVLEEDTRLVDRLVALGEEGMASAIAEGFDIDAFIQAIPNQS